MICLTALTFSEVLSGEDVSYGEIHTPQQALQEHLRMIVRKRTIALSYCLKQIFSGCVATKGDAWSGLDHLMSGTC